MQAYLISFFSAALAVTLVSLLAPRGENDGLSRSIRFLSTLILLASLILPILTALPSLGDLSSLLPGLPGIEDGKEDYRDALDEALHAAEKSYFTEMLTATLRERFDFFPEELRCLVSWETEADGSIRPTRVTVILSGQAIWQDPSPVEDFVEGLLGCPCVSAIE